MIWATGSRRWSRPARETAGGKGGGGKRTVHHDLQLFRQFRRRPVRGPDRRASAASGPTASCSTCRRRTTASIAAAEDQAPDPLIEAKEGGGDAPAYRGLAYLVFERLPLAEFGNRIPQLSFEVIRPVGGSSR